MLKRHSEITGCALGTSDEDFGAVKDIYFDDALWIARYLVADTGTWLPGRQVLLSPLSFGPPDWYDRRVPVNLTKDQIEHAPGLECDVPVSRQHEIELAKYYSWPAYWGERVMHGTAEALAAVASAESSDKKDPHLRSMNEVAGYHISANDGEIGHIEDFVIDTKTWDVSTILIKHGGWFHAEHVAVSPSCVLRVEWTHQKMHVNLTKEQISTESPVVTVSVDEM